MGRRHSDVTIREGTAEKYWYTLAAYVAACIVLIGGIVATQVGGGTGATVGTLTGLGMAFISFFGLFTYPALFKDAAYVRAVSRWNAKWWRYMAAGLGIPFVVYLGLSSAGVRAPGIAAYGLHALTALIVSVVYLYRRHQFVGVP